MRVLIVNTSEQTGGAAIAACRLTDALNQRGVKARMLVRDKQSARITTSASPSWWRLKWAFLWERLRIFMANGFRKRGLWAVDIANAGADITTLPEFQEADIIHLHWVNQGFLSLRQIRKILESGKPVVWTLHDLWPVTGICHHPNECQRYHTHCHDCPQLQIPASHDLSWRVFEHKKEAYAKGHITFIAVSEWTALRARESALTQGHDVITIPNVLPLEQLHSVDRSAARLSLGVPEGQTVIAFGAARIDQPAKGFDRLLEALKLVMMPVHLLLFGRLKDSSWLQRIPCAYTYVGQLEGPEALSSLYSAADLVVNASDYETFGLTLAEALACGCIPVSFDRGGQTDIIRHCENGYLAHYPDINDLAAGIQWAVGASLSPVQLRHSVANRFSAEAVARQHIDLYDSLVL